MLCFQKNFGNDWFIITSPWIYQIECDQLDFFPMLFTTSPNECIYWCASTFSTPAAKSSVLGGSNGGQSDKICHFLLSSNFSGFSYGFFNSDSSCLQKEDRVIWNRRLFSVWPPKLTLKVFSFCLKDITS